MIKTNYEGNKSFSVSDVKPSEPGPGEVRLKVAYCGVCGTDMHIYHGVMDKRVSMPVTIGHEMSGTVDKLGTGVDGVTVGEKVVVRPLDDRGVQASDKGYNHICKNLKFIGIDSPGAMQQYWNVPAFTLHKLPDHIDMKLAALTEPLAVACHDVRLSELQKEETAVILGGGPIGLLVALVAKSTGANVYISEVNPSRIALAKSLDLQVINPSVDDPVELIEKATDGRMADVVFEVAGVQPTIDLMTKIAGIRGRVVIVAIHGQPPTVNLFDVFWKELKLIGARVYEMEDYEQAISLITANDLPFESLITDIKPLSAIQSVFEHIDNHPDGMKILLNCQI